MAAIAGFAVLAALVAGGADFDLWQGLRKKSAPAAPIDWKPASEAPAIAPADSSMGYVKDAQPRWSAPALEPSARGRAGRACAAAGRWVSRLALEPGQEAVFDQDAPVAKRWCPAAHPWHSAKAKACYATEDCCRQQGWDCSRPTRAEPLPESLAERRRR